MKNLNNRYKKLLTDFDGIFTKIKPGMHIVTGIAAGEPQKLLSEFKKRIKKWNNLSLYTQFSFLPDPIIEEGMEKHLKYKFGFISVKFRDFVNSGRATFMPSHNSNVPKNFLSGTWPVDVAIIQVSPPDKNGIVSLGVSVDYIEPALRKAKIVLAQVNKYMPYTLGDSQIPLSKITALVEYNEPLIEFNWTENGKVEDKIGKFVSSLIPNGATLQMGNGTIPDCILKHLGNKKDLGIHTEMFCDNLIPLIEKGIITGRKKKIDKGKIVTGFIVGTNKLYQYVSQNKKILFKNWLYTNDPYVIAKNDNFISINSAVEVDLCGQVAAESVGSYEFSGTGGQVDFIKGSRLSKGGKSIIALPSTAKKESISRIVPYLSQGAVVTTTRDDVDYVVTEYGIAELRGMSLGERARELLKISHPKFRLELEKIIGNGKNKWNII